MLQWVGNVDGNVNVNVPTDDDLLPSAILGNFLSSIQCSIQLYIKIHQYTNIPMVCLQKMPKEARRATPTLPLPATSHAALVSTLGPNPYLFFNRESVL